MYNGYLRIEDGDQWRWKWESKVFPNKLRIEGSAYICNYKKKKNHINYCFLLKILNTRLMLYWIYLRVIEFKNGL